MFKIENGNKVECLITGFKGIVTSRVEYINGCKQYNVQPKLNKDGSNSKSKYIDEEQLKVIKGGISLQTKETGGPMDDDTPSEDYTG